MPNINSLFHLPLPDAWKETTVFTFEGPAEGGVKQNLVCSVLPGYDKKDDVAAFALGQLKSGASAFPGSELISQGLVEHPAQIPMHVATYSCVPTDGKVLFQRQYCFIPGDRAHIEAFKSGKSIGNRMVFPNYGDHSLDRNGPKISVMKRLQTCSPSFGGEKEITIHYLSEMWSELKKPGEFSFFAGIDMECCSNSVSEMALVSKKITVKV